MSDFVFLLIVFGFILFAYMLIAGFQSHDQTKRLETSVHVVTILMNKGVYKYQLPEIEALWSEFSRDYMSDFLDPTDENIEDFIKWLEKEKNY